MKIRFRESVTIPASGNEKELRFKDGSIHDLPDPSAYRWVRRNKAVYYVEEVSVPKLKVGRPMMEAGEKVSIFVKDSDFTKATKPAKRKPKRA